MKWSEFESILYNNVLPEGTKRAEVFHDVAIMWMFYMLVEELNNRDVQTKIEEAIKACCEILLEEEVEDFKW